MKLASIEVITSLQPIIGADRIELAQVLGFQTVVQKGTFKVGDLCVFHLPDTVVDANNPAYAWLAPSFRIKTNKFKGAYSRGLVMPLSILAFYGELEKTLDGFSLSVDEGVNTLDEPLPNP